MLLSGTCREQPTVLRIGSASEVMFTCVVCWHTERGPSRAPRSRRRGTHRLTRLQQWAIATATHRGRNKATIALANKRARIV